MKRDAKLRRLARNLAKQSMHAGKPAHNRVEAVIGEAQKLPVSRRRELLKAYHDYLAKEIARFEATVEHAGPLSDDAQENIAYELKHYYRHKIEMKLQPNDALLAGVRVRVGDDVFDASALGRLDRLKAVLS
ncbi:MAG: F0F1 ATP synthase subunit delta [Opitutales bacterium]